MKVAVIGAGLSGLSCALELKKLGIKADIYEKRSRVGDVLGYAGIWPRLFFRKKKDPVDFLKKSYGLSLKPISKLKLIENISPGKVSVVRGDLGYIVKRGVEPYSIENQISMLLKSEINFDSEVDLQEIKRKYDFVVVATGNNTAAMELGLWSTVFQAYACIATVVGNFKQGHTKIWFNTVFAKNAFGYLVPDSDKEAFLALIVNGVTKNEFEFYWKEFLKSSPMDLTIIETSMAEHLCGAMNSLTFENVYFIGNTAGATDDLIGFGGTNSIESGILAARSIASGKDYNKMMQPVLRHVRKLHEFRTLIDKLDNRGFDTLVSILGLPLVRQLVYNNPCYKLTDGFLVAKALNRLL